MKTRNWLVILGASLGAFMAILDIQITNASLREIQGTLGLDFAEGGWISTAYLIAEVVVIPLTGFFSEVFGMRSYMIFNSALFIGASVMAGLSWNLESMIGFRIIQGLTGGTLIPMAFQCMLTFIPEEKRMVGLSIFGIIITLAPTLGPAFGGWLTDNYGWRANFLINIFPGAIMLISLFYGMPRARMNLKKLIHMDFIGMVALTLWLGTLTYVLEEGANKNWFDDNTIRICFLVGLLSFPTFMATQLLRRKPLLKLKLLLNRNFGVAAIVTMTTAIALYGGIYSLSLYLGQVQNYSAQSIGSVMAWIGIPQIAVMPLLPWLMRRVDLRLLVFAGLVLFAVSNSMNSSLSMDYAGDQFKLSLFIRALGQPLFMIPLSQMGMALIHPDEVGDASAIYNVMRNLGGSIGIATAGTMILTRQNMHFFHLLEHVTSHDNIVSDRLSLFQQGFMIQGLGLSESKQKAYKLLVGLTQREALINAFSDVFLIMAVGILLTAFLVLLLKKVDVSEHLAHGHKHHHH